MTIRPLIIASAFTALALPTLAVAGASKDRDHDGMPTKWEQRYKLNPKANDAAKDKDHDGLPNVAEYQSKTSPRDADSDDDGTTDAREDSDHDGVENEIEAEHGLHPGRKDSDGVRDHQESAGSVASFDGTTLVLTLLDGSSLSGTVSARTEIECEGPRAVPSPSPAPAASAARLSGDEVEDDDAHPTATPKPSATPKPVETPKPSSSEDDDHADDHSGAGSSDDEAEDHGNSCDATDLVAGASVRKAKVRGGVFTKVHLNR
jgi:hypothetical protein